MEWHEPSFSQSGQHPTRHEPSHGYGNSYFREPHTWHMQQPMQAQPGYGDYVQQQQQWHYNDAEGAYGYQRQQHEWQQLGHVPQPYTPQHSQFQPHAQFMVGASVVPSMRPSQPAAGGSPNYSQTASSHSFRQPVATASTRQQGAFITKPTIPHATRKILRIEPPATANSVRPWAHEPTQNNSGPPAIASKPSSNSLPQASCASAGVAQPGTNATHVDELPAVPASHAATDTNITPETFAAGSNNAQAEPLQQFSGLRLTAAAKPFIPTAAKRLGATGSANLESPASCQLSSAAVQIQPGSNFSRDSAGGEGFEPHTAEKAVENLHVAQPASASSSLVSNSPQVTHDQFDSSEVVQSSLLGNYDGTTATGELPAVLDEPAIELTASLQTAADEISASMVKDERSILQSLPLAQGSQPDSAELPAGSMEDADTTASDPFAWLLPQEQKVDEDVTGPSAASEQQLAADLMQTGEHIPNASLQFFPSLTQPATSTAQPTSAWGQPAKHGNAATSTSPWSGLRTETRAEGGSGAACKPLGTQAVQPAPRLAAVPSVWQGQPSAQVLSAPQQIPNHAGLQQQQQQQQQQHPRLHQLWAGGTVHIAAKSHESLPASETSSAFSQPTAAAAPGRVVSPTHWPDLGDASSHTITAPPLTTGSATHSAVSKDAVKHHPAKSRAKKRAAGRPKDAVPQKSIDRHKNTHGRSGQSNSAAARPTGGSAKAAVSHVKTRQKPAPSPKPPVSNAFQLLGANNDDDDEDDDEQSAASEASAHPDSEHHPESNAPAAPDESHKAAQLEPTVAKPDAPASTSVLMPAVPADAKLLDKWEEEVDEGLVSIVTCAISHDVMRDPVICCDGHTYDRHAIEEWLCNHDTSPMTGAELTSKALVPNMALRDLVRDLFH